MSHLSRKKFDLDADVFRRFAEGNAAAYEEIFYAYVGLVQFIATKCGAPVEQRDDIVQETFMRLLKHRTELRDAGKVKTWLVTTARNIFIDSVRREKTAKKHAPEQASILSAHETVEVKLELKLQLVQEALAKVSRDEDTLELFYKRQMSAKEIAEMKGEAVSTVTTRLSRLRRKVRELVADRVKEIDDA